MENQDNISTQIEELRKRNFLLKIQFAQSKQAVKLYKLLMQIMAQLAEETDRKKLTNAYGK